MNNQDIKQSIEYIAFLMKQAHKSDAKPIVLLGAGASASAGIPLTGEIVEDIKDRYKDNPAVKGLINEDENDYYKVMGALSPDNRKDLFYEYITHEKVKINVTNIYLAQLLKEGYIDFILTVNFDDLILRACGLFNFLPPVYDISNINQRTTSNYREESVIYLHGQHYGQWLLNEKNELGKVQEDATNVFKEIKSKRTWIVVGYSGQDEIFKQLVSLGSFSNELFWVGYLDHTPNHNVMKNLIENPTANAHWIKGYDSDSFFLKLHSQIDKLETPDIFHKPFTFLKGVVNEVKDIEEYKNPGKHEKLYENVKERMKITNQWIDRAIKEIEEEDSVEKLKQEIIDSYTKEEFEQFEEVFVEKVKKDRFKIAKEELSDFYFSWGNLILEKAERTKKKNYYEKSFEKYKKSMAYNPKNSSTLSNWGSALASLAALLDDRSIYQESISKYEKSLKLGINNSDTYYNMGNSLANLARLLDDEEIYYDSFKKYEESICLNPKLYEAFCNWGVALGDLAQLTQNEDFFLLSFDKFDQALALNAEVSVIYNNWVSSLVGYSYLFDKDSEKRKTILNEAILRAKSVFRITGDSYNLSCVYALLGEKDSAFKNLDLSLKNGEINRDYIKYDKDWSEYLEDEDFIALLEKY